MSAALDREAQAARQGLAEHAACVDRRSRDRVFERPQRLVSGARFAQSGRGALPFALIDVAQRISGDAGDLDDGRDQIGRRDGVGIVLVGTVGRSHAPVLPRERVAAARQDNAQ